MDKKVGPPEDCEDEDSSKLAKEEAKGGEDEDLDLKWAEAQVTKRWWKSLSGNMERQDLQMYKSQIWPNNIAQLRCGGVGFDLMLIYPGFIGKKRKSAFGNKNWKF